LESEGLHHSIPNCLQLNIRQGVSVTEYGSIQIGASPLAASQSSSPPPPPPPPTAPPATASSNSVTPADSVAAVFADLNRGEAVTKGLRKVDKSEMTHKNPALRSGSVISNNVGVSPG
jgi:adenylyl cyclase-associated protein